MFLITSSTQKIVEWGLNAIKNEAKGVSTTPKGNP